MPDQQVLWDAEDSLAFCKRLRELQAAVQSARDDEARARSGYASARAARAKAELQLRACLEEDLARLPLFDRKPEPEPEPEATAAAEPQPVKLGLSHLAITEPGSREVADLAAALGHRSALWMSAGGDYKVLFDVMDFGNWDRNDRPSDDYRPTTGEIAAAASRAAGLQFEAADWGGEGNGGLMWSCLLRLRSGKHPEIWRTLVLDRLINSPVPRALARCHRIERLGQLAGWLEAGGNLTKVKGVTAKTAAPFMDGLRDAWLHTAQGEAGDRPGWLAPWPEAPAKPGREPDPEERTVTLAESGVSAEALTASYFAASVVSSKPGKAKVSPVEVAGALYGCRAISSKGAWRQWLLVRLHPVADYGRLHGAKHPMRDLTGPPGAEAYTALVLNHGKRQLVVGPAHEGLTVTSEGSADA